MEGWGKQEPTRTDNTTIPHDTVIHPRPDDKNLILEIPDHCPHSPDELRALALLDRLRRGGYNPDELRDTGNSRARGARELMGRSLGPGSFRVLYGLHGGQLEHIILTPKSLGRPDLEPSHRIFDPDAMRDLKELVGQAIEGPSLVFAEVSDRLDVHCHVVAGHQAELPSGARGFSLGQTFADVNGLASYLSKSAFPNPIRRRSPKKGVPFALTEAEEEAFLGLTGLLLWEKERAREFGTKLPPKRWGYSIPRGKKADRLGGLFLPGEV